MTSDQWIALILLAIVAVSEIRARFKIVTVSSLTVTRPAAGLDGKSPGGGAPS